MTDTNKSQTINQIRIKRREDEVYRINISDDGQEIVFDLLDINLPYKVNKAFMDIEKNLKYCEGNILAIKNKYKNQKPVKKGMITQEELEIQNEYRKMYQKDREAMDELLGKGTMQALFGDSNYLTMFDDLFEQLEPHLSRLEINVDSVKERLKKKYHIGENNRNEVYVMRYPEAIEVEGRRFKLDTSYQTAIRCFDMLQDEAVTDAERGVLIMLFLIGDIPELSASGMKRLQELLVKYLQCGKEPEQVKEMDEILTEREPDMDYSYDMGLIIASFISDYNIDLSDSSNDDMHWWKFIDLLNGLSPKSALSRVREIRNKDLSDYKDSPKAMEELIQAKRLVALPEKITESEREALDEFDRLLRGETKENG